MILAVDTATRWTGLALHDGQAILAELGWLTSKRQTVELAPAVADMLDRTGLKPQSVAAVAIAIGPGSYTGLRIGLGFAKGLALANQVRLIGVPTLDIVAAAQPWFDGNLVVIAEAGRTRVCASIYQWQSKKGWTTQERPAIDSWEKILEDLEGPAIFAGEISQTGAKLIRKSDRSFKLSQVANSVRRAGYLAEIGWRRLRRGWTDDPGTLAPIYLRDPAGAKPASE